MIATLSGIVAEKLGQMVVIEVQGVGYGLLVTNEDFGSLVEGQQAKLYVYEHIRENSHDIFGFMHLDTKSLFEQLLEVNGVGPRMALSILSVGGPPEVRQAIAGGDVRFIQQASGVGKRIAERIIVELKDKVGLLSRDLGKAGFLQSDAMALSDDAAKGLVSLGYSPQDAVQALQGIDPKLPINERIKQALQGVKR